MSKFKPGDKVKCIDIKHYHNSPLVLNKTYTVKDVGGGIELEGMFDIRFSPFRFELVKPAPDPNCYRQVNKKPVEDMSLDELIECANRGVLAKHELSKKYLKDVQVSPSNDGWCGWLGTNGRIYKFRKKPQKTFEPYTIENTGWSVGVMHRVDKKDEDIAIGCKTFNAKDLLLALKALAVSQEPEYPKASNLSGDRLRAFKATIKGVLYEGHILPWADAEELMNKLKEYLDETK